MLAAKDLNVLKQLYALDVAALVSLDVATSVAQVQRAMERRFRGADVSTGKVSHLISHVSMFCIPEQVTPQAHCRTYPANKALTSQLSAHRSSFCMHECMCTRQVVKHAVGMPDAQYTSTFCHKQYKASAMITSVCGMHCSRSLSPAAGFDKTCCSPRAPRLQHSA